MQEVGEEDPSNVADEEDSSDSTDFQDGMCSVGLYVLTTLVCRIIPMPDEIIQPNHGFHDVFPTMYALHEYHYWPKYFYIVSLWHS